jgi:hypothetical protein
MAVAMWLLFVPAVTAQQADPAPRPALARGYRTARADRRMGAFVAARLARQGDHRYPVRSPLSADGRVRYELA